VVPNDQLTKKKHVEKIAKTTLVINEAGTSMDAVTCTLPVTPQEFHSGDLKIPLATITAIWRKAEEIIKEQEAAIAPAPGFPEGKMVASRSHMRPHLIKCGKGGRISRDNDCPNFKFLGICSHTM
jgi:hypothetical protein